ncbi:MAG TPA: endonuclease NucS domain-containing protein [candidate division Zixibacteria bacterium]|nr:endonuclease NucS domain-containing protein [candidate division Zixibacteria bacterium]
MSYWIFTVTQHKIDGETYFASDILNQRIEDKFWGLGERTPNRRSLQKGDQVIFYVGLPRKVFAASAVLASDSFQLSKNQQAQFDHSKKFYRAEYGVLLEDIQVWSKPRLVEELISILSFIENKENWYSYFQGGVRQISENDFRAITEGRELTLTEKLVRNKEVVSESQFALESHLEEFIDQNWNNINFGSQLTRYEVEDQNGRQFPAGTWSIDFLCIDKTSNDLVIIELKRGKSSDSTVGQLLRYIGWVQENIAKPKQKVRGIIIAKEVDDALRYAVKGLQDVAILTYKVDFELSVFKKETLKEQNQ